MKLALAACAGMMALGAGQVAHAQDAYLGEIREFAFDYCPVGWAAADGAAISIQQNSALFSLLGTRYGGDGVRTFSLPNRSSAPAPAAPAPPAVGGEARVYEHCDLDGWSKPLGLGDYRAADLSAPYSDNNVSAVRASPGWMVTLFDGPNFDGASVTITGEDRCLAGARNFNDLTSSIRVTRAPAAPSTSSGRLGKTCIATQGAFAPRP